MRDGFKGFRRMATLLRALADILEDLGSILSTHMAIHNHNSSSRAPVPSEVTRHVYAGETPMQIIKIKPREVVLLSILNVVWIT